MRRRLTLLAASAAAAVAGIAAATPALASPASPDCTVRLDRQRFVPGHREHLHQGDRRGD